MASHDYVAALRSLRRSPGFVAIAVLSLGVAIGVNGTTFAMLDAVLHPYVPYANAEQLVTLRTYGWGPDHVDYSPEMLGTLITRRDLFASAVPWTPDGQYQTYSVGSESRQGRVVLVAPGFVATLGMPLSRGRGFVPYAADEPKISPAIVNFRIWRELFGGARKLDGLTIMVGDEAHPVVGVMPPAADYPSGTDVWLRMPAAQARSLVSPMHMQAIARLHPGDTRERVQSVLDPYAARVAREHSLPLNMATVMTNGVVPPSNGVWGIHYAVGLASLLVFLVACLNVANVMLARGLGRRREIAVRKAMGASGAAIVRYVMAEAVLLAAAGGVVGLMLASWGVEVVQAWMPAQLLVYSFRVPHFDWRVLVFVVVITGTTVLITGLLPAVRAQRADVTEAMKDGGYAVAGRVGGMYRALASAQLVLSLVVAMGATLMVRSLYYLAHDPSPFPTNGYRSTLLPSHAACRGMRDPGTYLSDIVTTARAVAGIEAAGAAIPARSPNGLVTSDQPSNPVQVPLGEYRIATPDWLRALGGPIVEGRGFEAGDAAVGAAIVNKAMAKMLWPLMSPVGRAIKLGPSASDAPWTRVVGVSSIPYTLEDGTKLDLAPPLTVAGRGICGPAYVAVRVKDDNPRIVGSLDRALRAALPGTTVGPLYGSEGVAIGYAYTQRVITLTYAGVALFTLLLAAGGVYAVMSLIVGQRKREFAVRIALGADGREMLRLVMRDALVIALAGIAVGAFGALQFSPMVGGWLYHVFPSDPLSLVLAEAVVVAATLLACIAPALRASRVDPVDVLRAS